MGYFRRIIEHYITTALRYAGAQVDIDTYSELGSALEEVVKLEQRVKALEEENKALREDMGGALSFIQGKGWL